MVRVAGTQQPEKSRARSDENPDEESQIPAPSRPGPCAQEPRHREKQARSENRGKYPPQVEWIDPGQPADESMQRVEKAVPRIPSDPIAPAVEDVRRQDGVAEEAAPDSGQVAERIGADSERATRGKENQHHRADQSPLERPDNITSPRRLSPPGTATPTRVRPPVSSACRNITSRPTAHLPFEHHRARHCRQHRERNQAGRTGEIESDKPGDKEPAQEYGKGAWHRPGENRPADAAGETPGQRQARAVVEQDRRGQGPKIGKAEWVQCILPRLRPERAAPARARPRGHVRQRKYARGNSDCNGQGSSRLRSHAAGRMCGHDELRTSQTRE